MSDERDPEVSQRYRELGAEAPSRELDQSILAAAHRAAARPHAPLVTPAGRHRWYFALGAAAVLLLAVAVTVQLERRQPDFEALPPSAPATTEPRQATVTAPKPAAPAREAARDAAPAAGRIPPASGPVAPAERSEARSQAGMMVEPPERWLERIVQLRKEGRHEEADRQLAEFRKRHPGYKVPEAALK